MVHVHKSIRIPAVCTYPDSELVGEESAVHLGAGQCEGALVLVLGLSVHVLNLLQHLQSRKDTVVINPKSYYESQRDTISLKSLRYDNDML